MSHLQITDLSFCEVVADKGIEIKGGLTVKQLTDGVLPLVNKYFPDITDIPVDVKTVSSEDVSSENIVQKIENQNAGISGYKVTSKDGTKKATVITGKNFNFASASASIST